MKNKKLLTLNDLYNFYFSKGENCTFSAKESGYQVSVQIPAQFEINKEQNDDSLLFCKVKLMHSGENRNHSSVTDNALKKCSATLAYKPILANFIEYTDESTGETLKDFTSHDMIHNDNGSTTYIEKQVGCFTSDEPFFEVEKSTGHNFLYGYSAIPREYTDAASIIERKNGTKISVELGINELSYNITTHVLELTDVIILGATLLGKDPDTFEDVNEGMLNARLDIADFSIENNSLFNNYESAIVEMQERLTRLESICFNDVNKISGKEETEVKDKENFNEEIETESAEIDKINVTNDKPDELTDNSSMDIETVERNIDEVVADEKKNYSVTVSYGDKNFSVSLQEKIYAIQDLVNATYGEQDNTYYGVTVYEDYVVMENYWNNRYFKQKYSDMDGTYSLTGDRVEVFAEFVTESEYVELQNMRANYSSIVEKLEKYEEAEELADKATVFEDEAYADYLETEEFKNLMSKENLKSFSKEELKEKADAAYGRIVKSKKNFAIDNTVEVAKKKKKTVTIFSDVDSSSEDSVYGDYFKSL